LYIEFASAVIIAFKAFKRKQTFALNGLGVVHVIGENRVTVSLDANGASKSTLWDAICWCLYGKTPFGLGTNDIKPWLGGNPSVTVLIVADGREYLCQRVTSPKNLFTVNGEERADISEILPISFKLFISTILLPQGKDLFFDLQPKDKMALISEACDLERWDLRSLAASKAADAIDVMVNQFLEEQRHEEGALAELERTIDDVKIKSRAWGDKAAARVQVSKKALLDLEKRYERLTNELGSAVLAEDGALTELRASENRASDLGREGLVAMGRLDTLKARCNTLNNLIDDAEEELANLSTARECPMCGQPVKVADLVGHRQHLTRKSEGAAAELKAKTKERKVAVRDGEAIYASLEQSNIEAKQFRQKANEATDIITRLRPEVESLKREISDAKKVKEEINPHLETLKTLGGRRKQLKENLEDINEDIADTQAKAARARYWVKAFKDIKLQLIEEVLQELELTTNSMIEEVGLVDWEVHCDIEKETKKGTTQRLINIEISSPESRGKLVKWESYSGGERQRLRLIGSLALSDVLLARIGVDTNLEILDEPSVYWSLGGVRGLSEFLAYRAREREKTIFYVDHSAVESPHFSEVMRVIKEDDGAYIT
jgi:DNA repair exonuclease SbcCD ATPase subunit